MNGPRYRPRGDRPLRRPPLDATRFRGPASDPSVEDRIRELKQRSLYRLWMSNPSIAIGPLDGSLTARTEASWGAGLLELNRYAEYTRAIQSNRLLLHGLAVSHRYLMPTAWRLC